MKTEFYLNVVPHNKMEAVKLRVICDRWGFYVPDGEELANNLNVGLAFSIIVEAYSDNPADGVVSKKSFSGVYQGQQDPYSTVKTVALGLFPDSDGNSMKEAPTS